MEKLENKTLTESSFKQNKMEELEFQDWGITPFDSPNDRRVKSISAYYLPRWYHKIQDLTFSTLIYPLTVPHCGDSLEMYSPENVYQGILTSLPEKLPFTKCMVRYENKSPKDSSFWGPINTNREAAKLLTTSLTLQNNIGQQICVREWKEILSEYRCFWKGKPNVVESLNDLDKNQCQEILDYLLKIKDRIPYQRCIIDLAETSEGFKIIEFNSWETLSRGYHSDWIRDTDILDGDHSEIIFRTNTTDQLVLSWPSLIYSTFLNHPTYPLYSLNEKKDSMEKISENSSFKILKPSQPSCWLITERYIYICSEIWLGQFTRDGKNVAWKRGQYRFSFIYPCDRSGYIFIGDHQNKGQILDECLKPISEYLEPKPKIDLSYYNTEQILPFHSQYRYGCICWSQNELKFCRMFNDGTFQLTKF